VIPNAGHSGFLREVEDYEPESRNLELKWLRRHFGGTVRRHLDERICCATS
jgi:hypothetical protein